MEDDMLVVNDLESNGRISKISSTIPYCVNRTVIKQKELKEISGFNQNGNECKKFISALNWEIARENCRCFH